MNCTQEVHNVEYLHLYFTNVSLARADGKDMAVFEDGQRPVLLSVIILQTFVILILIATLFILNCREAFDFYSKRLRSRHRRNVHFDNVS